MDRWTDGSETIAGATERSGPSGISQEWGSRGGGTTVEEEEEEEEARGPVSDD